MSTSTVKNSSEVEMTDNILTDEEINELIGETPIKDADKELREKISQELESKLRKEFEDKYKEKMAAFTTLQNAREMLKESTNKLVNAASNIVEVKRFEVSIVRKMDDGIRDRCPRLNRDMTQCHSPITLYCSGVCLRCYNKELKKEDKKIAAVQKKMNLIRERQNDAKRKAQEDVELAQDDYQTLKKSRKHLAENTNTLKSRVEKRAADLANGIESDDELSEV